MRTVMQALDPEGTRLHRVNRLVKRQYYCPGPNFVWHIDSFDKLKWRRKSGNNDSEIWSLNFEVWSRKIPLAFRMLWYREKTIFYLSFSSSFKINFFLIMINLHVRHFQTTNINTNDVLVVISISIYNLILWCKELNTSKVWHYYRIVRIKRRISIRCVRFSLLIRQSLCNLVK